MIEWLLLVLAGVMAYAGYQFSKRRPDMFSAESLTSAAGTLGVLAIFLISIVVFGVMFLRQL